MRRPPPWSNSRWQRLEAHARELMAKQPCNVNYYDQGYWVAGRYMLGAKRTFRIDVEPPKPFQPGYADYARAKGIA